jgi:hypothetical protein
MGALGVSLIVLGLAFVFSGPVFLLPTGRKPSDLDTFEENQRRTALYLQGTRNEKTNPIRNRRKNAGRSASFSGDGACYNISARNS